MKQIIIATLLILSLGIVCNAQAQTGPTGATGATGTVPPPPPPIPDVNICIKIPGHKIARLKRGFFVIRPIPDNYTEKQWFKKCIRDYIKSTVLEGENRLRHKAADSNVNNDDVTE